MDIVHGTQNEPLTRREREKAAHRQEILDAAVRVFSRRGFAAATLDEIAQEAEFSKGAIYLYFPSKEDLLFNMIMDLGHFAMEGFKKVLCGAKSFREELTDLFTSAAEFMFTHRERLKIAMSLHMISLSGLPDDAFMKICTHHQEMVGMLCERTRKARENGEIRDVPIEAVAWMIHGSLDSMAVTKWGYGTVEELKEASLTFVDILFSGIENKKE